MKTGGFLRAIIGISLAVLLTGCSFYDIPDGQIPDPYEGVVTSRFHTDEEMRDRMAKDVSKNQGEPLTIGLSQIGSESDWRIASTASVQAAFSSENGYNLIFDDAQQKQENQLKALREFIDQNVDYIILDPCVETGWDSVLKEARDAGIPVIVYDRRVAVEDEGLYSVWIGSDFNLEGERACKYLDEFLKLKHVKSNINIVDIQGTIGATAQIGRSAALEKAVMLNKNWFLLERISGDFTEAKGGEVMEDMLESFGDTINVVYCENDNMALGAIEKLKSKGYRVGSDIDKGEIAVLSFDATRRGLEHTLNGDIVVNTECSPLYGPVLTHIVQALKNGEEPEHDIYIDEEQFATESAIGMIHIGNDSYEVKNLTQEIIDGRIY